MDRRQFLTTTAGIALGGFAASAPAIAQAKTKLRVGYLHTVAVDGQIWTGMDRGTFDKQGLDLELRQFNTGLEIFQALIGGSLDVLATGAVLSNFPARGQGKVFLINDIEVATDPTRASNRSRTSRASGSRRRPAPPPMFSSTRRYAPTRSIPRKLNSSTRPCRRR